MFRVFVDAQNLWQDRHDIPGFFLSFLFSLDHHHAFSWTLFSRSKGLFILFILCPFARLTSTHLSCLSLNISSFRILEPLSCLGFSAPITSLRYSSRGFSVTQLCPTLCNPMDCKDIFHESESEVAQSCPTLCDPMDHQAPPSMGFSRQEYWSALPFPSPGNLPNSGIEPWSPTCRQMFLPSEIPGKSILCYNYLCNFYFPC